MSNPTSRGKETVDGLPKQFVSSLRILFDILDETRSGYVRFKDIESRWSDDGIRGLPSGVIDGLRKVTPANGLLSFDRFVAGLKLVLIKKRESGDVRVKENRTPLQEFNLGERGNARDGSTGNKFGNDARFSDKHYGNGNREYEKNGNQHRSQRQQYDQNNSAKGAYNHEHRSSSSHRDSHYDVQNPRERSPPVQASNGGTMSRAISQPTYAIKPEVSNYPSTTGGHHQPTNSSGAFRQVIGSNHDRDRAPAIPPRSDRPPRTAHSPNMKKSMSGPNLASKSHSPPTIPPRSQHQSAWILSDLKNWQKEWTGKQNGDRKYGHEKVPQPRTTNQDNGIYANIEQFQRQPEQDLKHPAVGPLKATVQRHGSGRRHTLANGIDQNMMKRMKQLEEETAMLRSGLLMVDSARDWYMKQLAQVSDKQAMLGKVVYNDNSVEAHQERMNFQRARIAEINQHLETLVESSEKGFPIHMNLALSTPTNKAVDNASLHRLQERNRQLREEVGQKKEYITQLEMEKASLVRDLFEVRSKNNSGHDDTTFM